MSFVSQIFSKDIKMFKKVDKEKQRDEKIQQLEKSAMERGLVENQRQSADDDNLRSPAAPAAAKTGILGKLRRKTGSRRILLIDDDEQFRNMVRQYLQRCGYEVTEARDGEEGVRLFLEDPVELVISDVIMPEKEGIETVMEIKRQFPQTKIIVVSGGGWYGTDIDFDMAKKLDAVTLKKPFELPELTAAIEQLLK